MPVGKPASHVDQLILYFLDTSVQALFLGLCPLDAKMSLKQWQQARWPVVHVALESFHLLFWC